MGEDHCADKASSSSGGGGGFQLSDNDLDKIINALGSRLPQSVSFHIFEFILGLLIAIGIVALYVYKSKHRFFDRHRQKEFVESLRQMDDEQIKRVMGDTNLPSWINYPDFERVAWINTILTQIWPSVNSAVSQQFRDLLGPLLRQNKPSWIASLKLFRFDLGDAAPQANGVKVYSQKQGSEEIMIEVDFSWVGNQDVQLTMKPIPKHLGPFSPAGALLSSIIRLRAGIERIIVNGRVRFMFKPLLGELPIIGGMQAALVEMPKFSFDVTMYGGDVSLVPGLEQWLTTFMKDTVFRPYILPEVYSSAFTEAAEDEQIRPKAILFIKMIGAKHVPKMDIISQSDPYVRCFVRYTTQLRTSTKDNNANPTWNENFKLLVHDPDHQVLTCILMDYDDFNPDDEIGRCELPMKGLTEETKDLWLDVDMNAEGDEEDEQDKKHPGFFGTLIDAEQKVADQGEKVWKKLPGVKDKKRKCQIHLEATLYMLDSDDLDEAMLDAGRQSQSRGRQAEAEAEQRRKVQEVDHGRNKDVGGNIGEEEQAASLPQDEPNGKENESDVNHDGKENSPDVNHEDTSEETDGGSGKESSMEFGNIKTLKKKEAQSGDGEDEGEVQGSVRSQALDALRGGILYVKPRKADSLVRKPWYKGSFLHSTAQLEVSICGQHKSSTAAKGSRPIFSETLEFLLGGKDIKNAEHQRLKIEIWDHKLHINHFRGGCSILLKDILDAKRIRNTLRLVGVKQGELSLEVYWISALQSAGRHHGATKAVEHNT